MNEWEVFFEWLRWDNAKDHGYKGSLDDWLSLDQATKDEIDRKSN